MSFIGGIIGGSGGQGAGFNAASPQNSSIVSPTDIRQFQNNLTSGLGQQQSLYDALAAQNGVGNQSAVFQQQQALANQLQQSANGQGPNPAQAQLAQATGANTANQAALMAGQRGTSGNAGLLARQAAMQGGANQQAAAGQAATMGAQQQIAARQQLMQQQGAMAGLAGQQVGQQQQQGNAYTQNALGATTGFLNAATGLQSNANNANASIAGGNAKNQAGLLGGLLGGAGSAMGLAQGGEVPYPVKKDANYAIGGDVQGGQGGSTLAAFMNGQQGGIQDFGAAPSDTVTGHKMPKGLNTSGAIAGGPGDAMGMPVADMTMMASKGALVPGTPKQNGNHASNDTVNAVLTPHEIVLPLSVTQAKDAPEKARAFVAAILAKNGRAK